MLTVEKEISNEELKKEFRTERQMLCWGTERNCERDIETEAEIEAETETQ